MTRFDQIGQQPGHVLLAALMLILLLAVLSLSLLHVVAQDAPGISAMREQTRAQHLAEGAVDLIINWFHQPSAAPPSVSGALMKRQDAGQGPSFFDAAGRSQFVGTADRPDILLDASSDGDAGILNGSTGGFTGALSEVGRLDKVKVYAPGQPGLLGTVEVMASTRGHRPMASTVKLQLAALNIPAIRSAIQTGQELGNTGSGASGILAHWGDFRVMGDLIVNRISDLVVKSVDASVTGQSYETQRTRDDRWVDYWIGGHVSDLDRMVEEATGSGTDIEALLLDRHHVPKDVLGAILSDYYQCPYLPFDERTVIDAELARPLNHDYLEKNLWLPVARRGQLLDVLTHDPHDLERGWDVRRSFPGMTIRYSVGLRRDIERFLGTLPASGKSATIGMLLTELVEEVPPEPVADVSAGPVDENDSLIVRLASHLITEADRVGASDLHLEPCIGKKEMNIRFRVDGTCFTYTKVPAVYRRALVSRIKIMANLDIAERRKPQDGKIRFKLGGQRTIELRVATLPTAGGNEDAVLRLLTAKEPMPLDAMELMPVTRQTIKALAEKPHGIFLCVGPTGSGKTTLLHAILKHINTEERKIWTAEDPIEISQEGLRQLQIHQKIGLDFETAMRAFLRADPDVIMIGEMRDKETADIAIEASLTGHLVFSTLHTNSAVETVIRLLDLGCDPFNFADAVLGVLATRLCKRICAACTETYRPSREEYEELLEGQSTAEGMLVPEYEQLLLSRGRGCEQCHRSGFRGRVPLHELLVGTHEIKQLIQSRARTSDMLTAAIHSGMQTLLSDGIRKVIQGFTTYRQVRAVAAK